MHLIVNMYNIQSIPKISCQQYWAFNFITNINYELKYLLLAMIFLSSSCSWKWESHSMDCFTDVLISLCQANHEKTVPQNNKFIKNKTALYYVIRSSKNPKFTLQFKWLKWTFLKNDFHTNPMPERMKLPQTLSCCHITPPNRILLWRQKPSTFYTTVNILSTSATASRQSAEHTLLQHNKKRGGISLEWDS